MMPVSAKSKLRDRLTVWLRKNQKATRRAVPILRTPLDYTKEKLGLYFRRPMRLYQCVRLSEKTKLQATWSLRIRKGNSLKPTTKTDG